MLKPHQTAPINKEEPRTPPMIGHKSKARSDNVDLEKSTVSGDDMKDAPLGDDNQDGAVTNTSALGPTGKSAVPDFP